MYRLMIVDNEEYVVNGLVDLFSRLNDPDMELEVIGAYSSKDALELMMRTKIDIVISDIRMPGMSGLELQRIIQGRWSRCKTIFLSGYDDFNYAQEAMRYGSVNYILKTEGDEVIIEAVKRAIHLLRDDSELQQIVQQAKLQLQKAITPLQREYFSIMLNGDPYAFRQMEKQFAELDIPLSPNKPVFVVAGRIDEWNEQYGYYDQSLLLYGLQNIAKEYLSLSAVHVSFVHDRSRVVWFIQPVSEDNAPSPVLRDHLWRMTRHFIYGTFESIQSTCLDLLHLPISVAISRDCVSWDNVGRVYAQLGKYFQSGTKKQLLVVEGERIDEQTVQEEVLVDTKQLMTQYELLSYNLEHQQQSAFHQILRNLLDIGSHASRHGNWLLATQISTTVLSIIQPYAKILPQPDSAVAQASYNPELLLNWHEAEAEIKKRAEALFEHKKTDAETEGDEIIHKVNAFIQSRLGGDLTLNAIAQAIGHNPSYLSRLYKHKAGLGLSEYIMEARLRLAKELLAQPQYKISEVSKGVGFLSEHYFYRFFKRATKLTPQEYREQLVNKGQ
ncbi:response regulator [Paenibacillus sp. BC26]|uniref:response regulator n=1 Tax=Paenibacillus sp. BC26 TaxID=1881032 RepID=UPI0008EA1D0E|nr:response regulator [Paenibacillus sp. BC26]SFS87691.1 two-component system, response regulator YesN [Paenibacillus sp. BC26]